MKIDLSTIEGEPESFVETLELDDSALDPTRVTGTMTVRLEGTVRAIGGRFVIDGTTAARGRLSCGRCLEPVEWRMDSTFDLEVALAEAAPLDPEIALDEADLDVVYADEAVLDLEELAMEQVMLELPIRVLCSDDCAGLCPRCGANRNVAGACRCEPETDPRWEALRDLAGGTPAD